MRGTLSKLQWRSLGTNEITLDSESNIISFIISVTATFSHMVIGELSKICGHTTSIDLLLPIKYTSFLTDFIGLKKMSSLCLKNEALKRKSDSYCYMIQMNISLVDSQVWK